MKLLQQEAYEHLKEMIINGELAYDVIYSETRMSQSIGVSRTPFRDAIQRLVQEGYVDIIPSKGFQLHNLSEQDVIETFQVRCAVESFCALCIAEKREEEETQKLIRMLEDNISFLRQICGNFAKIEEVSSVDYTFHETIVKYCGNQILISLFQTYMYRIISLSQLFLSHPEHMEEICCEHERILEAIKSGDTADIVKTTYSHMMKPLVSDMEDLKNSSTKQI